jgi:mutator protein MutT
MAGIFLTQRKWNGWDSFTKALAGEQKEATGQRGPVRCYVSFRMSEPPIEVAAGLVFRDGRLLITQRLPDDHLGGLWEFPGGKREQGETFEECVRRELKEELGIEVEVGGLLDRVAHRYPEKIVHLKFFRCKWRKHEPRALGCHAFAWITASQLNKYAFPGADEKLLQKLRASAEWWK